MTDITININTGSENSEPKITATTDNAKTAVPSAELSVKEETPKVAAKEEITSETEVSKDESIKKENPKKMDIADEEQAKTEVEK
ncbi:hypothetical protein ABIB40_001736 [Pedobacter sp. UYP30]|uniref:hypothetical protein n=1 Tax=Pedobacter sp. UYP30 TaxID=1756400 RepID=UPI003393C7D1